MCALAQVWPLISDSRPTQEYLSLVGRVVSYCLCSALLATRNKKHGHSQASTSCFHMSRERWVLFHWIMACFCGSKYSLLNHCKTRTLVTGSFPPLASFRSNWYLSGEHCSRHGEHSRDAPRRHAPCLRALGSLPNDQVSVNYWSTKYDWRRNNSWRARSLLLMSRCRIGCWANSRRLHDYTWILH